MDFNNFSKGLNAKNLQQENRVKEDNKMKLINEFNLKKELHDLVEAGLNLSAASKYLAKKNNLKKSVIYDIYKEAN